MSLRRKASKDADWKHTGWIIMHTHTHNHRHKQTGKQERGDTGAHSKNTPRPLPLECCVSPNYVTLAAMEGISH